ncbi:MAG: hypothetical protein ABIP10_20035 [Ferruginibacter sp.]
MANIKKRQAVIVIHGIGEQHPIVTLRDFVESVAEQLKKNKLARQGEALFWDKPDPVSGNYETRKMTMRGGKDHPTTDFYEFYWAHHMRNTNWSHIQDWLQRVIFRLPKNVSKRLLPVFLFVWFLIAIVVSAMLLYILKHGVNDFTAKTTAISSGIVATIVLGILSKFLFNYLGDAGRYLDPSPENISERQAIREDGMKLLKNLHESGRYQRIIIVSHSLGSVIAYDLVKFLWNEYYKTFDPLKFAELYKSADKQQLHDVDSSEEAGKNLDESTQSTNYFQNAQGKSYEYLKAIGNKWLITDLVTIGSPLTHVGHLFVQEDGLFEKLKEQREYPTCPPHFQHSETTNIIKSEQFNVAEVDHPLVMRHFNHSSPFAVTKWTNMYYSSDFIGGPLKEAFGAGIKDIEVKTKNWFFIYPKGHTEYWSFNNTSNVLNNLWFILKVEEKKKDDKQSASNQ